MLPYIYLFKFKLPTYPLIISLVYCLALISIFIMLKNKSNQRRQALDIFFLLCFASFFGARLFHILFESLDFYLQNPLQAFYFWNGGFVYYGGLLVGALALFIYAKFEQLNIFKWFDFFAPILSSGYLLGRFACLLNGCCYGTPTKLPWSIQFVDEYGGYLARHPTQIYLSIGETPFLLFYYFYLRKRKFSSGVIFLIWILFHSISRFIIEFYRDDFRGIIWGLSLSGWTSLLLIILSAFFLLKKIQPN